MMQPPMGMPVRPQAPKRMSWKDVDFVVRQQMKALRNLSYEDDYYFHALREKQIRERSGSQGGGIGGARGKGQMRVSKWAAKTEERCKAWADTQKTLGYQAKSNLRAPRQLLDMTALKNKKKRMPPARKKSAEEGRTATPVTEEGKAEAAPAAAAATENEEGAEEEITFKALQQLKWRSRATIEHGMSTVLKLGTEIKRIEALTAAVKQRPVHRAPSRGRPGQVRIPPALAKRRHFLQKELARVWSLPTSAEAQSNSAARARGDEVEGDDEEWAGLELLKLLKGKKLLRRSLAPQMLSLRQRVALLEKAAKYLVHFVYSTSTDERDEAEADDLNAAVTQSLVAALEAPNIPLTCLTSCLKLLTQSQTLEMIPYLLQFKASADVVRALLVRGEAAAEDIANPTATRDCKDEEDEEGEEEKESDDDGDEATENTDTSNPNWRSRNGSESMSPEDKAELEAKKAARAEKRKKARAQAVVDWHAALDSLKAKIAAGTAQAAGSAAE